MVQVYTDLVQLGLRSLEENIKGIILVPQFLKEKVREEIKNREEFTK